MRKDYQKAEQLRQRGKSYKEISRTLSIPLGTLSGWFKNKDWSQKIRDKLSLEQSLSNPESLKRMAAANKKRWADLHEQYRKEAILEFPKLKDNPLFISGLMLYWGEGDRSKGPHIRLTNSDPGMIKLFYLFLIKILGIPAIRIKAGLILYPDLIDAVQKNFWSNATGLPTSQFNKSVYINGRHPKKRLSYGVCVIYLSHRECKEKVIKWIELYRDYIFANHIA